MKYEDHLYITRKEEVQEQNLVESLSPYFQKLSFACRKLKAARKVNDTWFFNVRLFLKDLSDNKVPVHHISDLYKLFGVELVDSFFSTRQQ